MEKLAGLSIVLMLVLTEFSLSIRGQNDSNLTTSTPPLNSTASGYVTPGDSRDLHKGIRPSCRGLCECFSEAMDNNSISPACFRIKGNSSRLITQLMQANANDERCAANGETTRFECVGNKMACVYTGSKNVMQNDSHIDDLYYSSSGNESDLDYHGPDIDRAYTYVTCELVPRGLSCRIDRNDTKPTACLGTSRVNCHYKAPRKVKREEKCEDGWLFKKKRCHLFVNHLATFDQAYRRCRLKGAYLLRDISETVRSELAEEWNNSTHWSRKDDSNATERCAVTNADGVESYSNCTDRHTFSCYKEVFKFLNCNSAPEAIFAETTVSTTTERETTVSTTTERETTVSTTTERETTVSATTERKTTMDTTTLSHAASQKEKLNAARDVLEEKKEEIGNYVSQFTNDSSPMEILNTIIDAEPPPLNDSQDDNAASMATEMVAKLDSLVDSLAKVVSGPGEPLSIVSPELVIKVVPLCQTCSSDVPTPTLRVNLNNDSFAVSIPGQASGNGATVAMSVVGAFDDVMSANMESEGSSRVDGHNITSLVATVSVKKWDGTDIYLDEDSPFQITFTNKAKPQSDTASHERDHSYCCYWKPDDSLDGGMWSTKGCLVSSVNATHTTCSCEHLTSFAVLMRLSKSGAPQSKEATKIQDYMTYVGCGLSMACLLTMLLIFTIQKLYRSDRNIIHMNLALALLISQAVFLFGIERTEIWQVCKTIGVSLHFFLLATFFWMLVEGIFLISKTTSTKNRFLKIPVFMAIGWGGPVLIVGVTAAVSFKSYGIEELCWLTNNDGGIWAFVGPAIAIVVTNIILLCQVIRVFLSLKTNMKKAHVERIWLALRAMLLTLPLLGSTWLFGMLSFNTHTVFFSYVFIVLNSLQGVFIFVLYCVMNDEVKKVVEKKLNSIGRISGWTSNGRSTRSTT